MSPCIIITTQLLVVNKATFTSIKVMLATSCFPGNRSNIPRSTPPPPTSKLIARPLLGATTRPFSRQQKKWKDNKKKRRRARQDELYIEPALLCPPSPTSSSFSCADKWINWVQVSGDTQESWLTLPRGWWQFCSINNPSGDHYRAAEGAHYSIYVVFGCIGGCN